MKSIKNKMLEIKEILSDKILDDYFYLPEIFDRMLDDFYCYHPSDTFYSDSILKKVSEYYESLGFVVDLYSVNGDGWTIEISWR